jgi:hypothetical protein
MIRAASTSNTDAKPVNHNMRPKIYEAESENPRALNNRVKPNIAEQTDATSLGDPDLPTTGGGDGQIGAMGGSSVMASPNGMGMMPMTPNMTTSPMPMLDPTTQALMQQQMIAGNPQNAMSMINPPPTPLSQMINAGVTDPLGIFTNPNTFGGGLMLGNMMNSGFQGQNMQSIALNPAGSMSSFMIGGLSGLMGGRPGSSLAGLGNATASIAGGLNTQALAGGSGGVGSSGLSMGGLPTSEAGLANPAPAPTPVTTTATSLNSLPQPTSEKAEPIQNKTVSNSNKPVRAAS